MINERNLFETFILLSKKIKNGAIVGDGEKATAELIGRRIEFDPSANKLFDFGGIRKTSLDYCLKEMIWYDSQNLNINGYVDDVKIWKQVSTKDGRVNSNYGWVIYSEENGNQFDSVVEHLTNDQFTRQGIMIFNRPSIHKDWNQDGMHDFICSTAYHFFIRNNQLIAVYTWRSEDLIFGLTGSDYYFASAIYDRMFDTLRLTYPDLQYGRIIWFVNSLHVYKRHWDMTVEIAKWFDQQLLKGVLQIGVEPV